MSPAPVDVPGTRGRCVTVTVSGPVGVGKSAVCGEIEILCKALGLQVEWDGGQQERNLTHGDWTGALEQYKPRVVIRERVERSGPYPAPPPPPPKRTIYDFPNRPAQLVRRVLTWARAALARCGGVK